MSCDFGINKNRVDVITGCEPGIKVYRTWTQVVKAIQRGERVIKTTRVNRAKDTYDKLGWPITIGCYSNQFCRLLRDIGITDVRYGSGPVALRVINDVYTIYLPKRVKL